MADPTECRIVLNWPPSANNLFATAAGSRKRFRTKEYEDWRREAGWTLQAQRPPKFNKPVTVTIELCPPHARRFDLDNRAKCLLDLLVTHQVVKDDNSDFIRSVTVTRVDNAAPCTVTIRGVE